MIIIFEFYFNFESVPSAPPSAGMSGLLSHVLFALSSALVSAGLPWAALLGIRGGVRQVVQFVPLIGALHLADGILPCGQIQEVFLSPQTLGVKRTCPSVRAMLNSRLRLSPRLLGRLVCNCTCRAPVASIHPIHHRFCQKLKL